MLSRVLQVTTVLALVGVMALGVHYMAGREAVCDLCHRPIHEANGYRIELESGEIIEACCPRCGLRFQAGRNDVVSVWAVDYPTGSFFDAREVYYVEDSEVNLCRMSHEVLQRDSQGNEYDLDWDRCEPGLIAFQSRDAALQFIHGNGGVIRTYEQLLDEEM